MEPRFARACRRLRQRLYARRRRGLRLRRYVGRHASLATAPPHSGESRPSKESAVRQLPQAARTLSTTADGGWPDSPGWEAPRPKHSVWGRRRCSASSSRGEVDRSRERRRDGHSEGLEGRGDEGRRGEGLGTARAVKCLWGARGARRSATARRRLHTSMQATSMPFSLGSPLSEGAPCCPGTRLGAGHGAPCSLRRASSAHRCPGSRSGGGGARRAAGRGSHNARKVKPAPVRHTRANKGAHICSTRSIASSSSDRSVTETRAGLPKLNPGPWVRAAEARPRQRWVALLCSCKLAMELEDGPAELRGAGELFEQKKASWPADCVRRGTDRRTQNTCLPCTFFQTYTQTLSRHPFPDRRSLVERPNEQTISVLKIS